MCCGPINVANSSTRRRATVDATLAEAGKNGAEDRETKPIVDRPARPEIDGVATERQVVGSGMAE